MVDRQGDHDYLAGPVAQKNAFNTYQVTGMKKDWARMNQQTLMQ